MKFLLAALLVFVGAAAQAATYYGFKIGGVSVTSDNFNNVRSSHMSAYSQNVNGGDYLVTYNPDTKIVVLYNVNIERTGSGKLRRAEGGGERVQSSGGPGCFARQAGGVYHFYRRGGQWI